MSRNPLTKQEKFLRLAAYLGGIALIFLIAKSNLAIMPDLSQAKKLEARSFEKISLNEQLLRMAGQGDLMKVRQLVEKGADINYKDEYRWTPLIQAAAMNRLDVVKYLVIKGAKVNAQGEDRSTALQHAVIYDHVAMVKFLLSQGADLEQKAKYEWNARETAINRNREKVAHFFEAMKDELPTKE